MRVLFLKAGMVAPPRQAVTPRARLQEHEGERTHVRNSVMLLAREGRSTAKDLAAHTGLPVHRVAYHLGALREQGHVIRDGEHYRLAGPKPVQAKPEARLTDRGPEAKQLGLFKRLVLFCR